MLLINGQISQIGSSDEVVRNYLSKFSGSPAERIWNNPDIAPGDEKAKLHSVRVCDVYGEVLEKVDIDRPFFIEIKYWNYSKDLKLTAIIHLIDKEGTVLFASNDWNNDKWWNTPREVGLVVSRCQIPANFLSEGVHNVLVAVNNYNPDSMHIFQRDVVSFIVVDQTEGNGVRKHYSGGRWPGVVRPMLEWDVKFFPLNDRVSN